MGTMASIGSPKITSLELTGILLMRVTTPY